MKSGRSLSPVNDVTGRVLAPSPEEDKRMTRRSVRSFALVAAVGMAASIVLCLGSNPAAANTVVINSGTATYSLGFLGNSTTTADPPPAPPAPFPSFTVSGLTAVNVTSPPPQWGVFSTPWIGPTSNGDGGSALPSGGAAGPFYLNGTNSTFSAPQGFYYYTTTFTLTAPGPYVLQGGSWVSDNQGLAIYINGINLGETNPGNFGGPLTPFTIPSADFAIGTNTLTFVTWNENYAPGHGSPTGINIQGTITNVPEPATIAVAMSGLPLFGLFWAWRRRKRV
jgi:PEP-CTERM motif